MLRVDPISLRVGKLVCILGDSMVLPLALAFALTLLTATSATSQRVEVALPLDLSRPALAQQPWVERSSVWQMMQLQLQPIPPA